MIKRRIVGKSISNFHILGSNKLQHLAGAKNGFLVRKHLKTESQNNLEKKIKVKFENQKGHEIMGNI
jgi:hypothetical protein